MRKLILTITILFSGLLTFGQDTKLANTLLWRISGNGLARPSYLYGTMHLTDKRVFQLGDSVYKALEQTEGFAAELDMNRLGTQMMNQFLNEEEQKNATEPPKVKERVSGEVWNKYKALLEKKIGKKADKITVDDLDKIESRLQLDLFKKGDMPTFLDAWLSGQARKQGKWVGGIEDIEDQLEHMDGFGDIEEKIQLALFDDNYYRGSLEWFIKVYTNQQLDTIDAFMYREEDGRKDYIMIKRNLKMARRMDSLSAIRSTLFAVGAAHLPGDSGVITLLRSRGFTVTPVISSKKINPDKYVSKTVEASWIQVAVKDNVYALQMPGVAEGIEMFESMGLEMKIYFDISFMKMYMTMGIEIPEERKKLGADSLYNGLRSRYASKGEVLKEKPVTVNGVEGREYRISTYEGEMKMQIFIPATERVILNMVYGFTEKSLSDKETEKFFQSFVLNKDIIEPKVTTQKTWSLLEYPVQSFSVEMPVKPREKKDVVTEEGKITYDWQAIDIKEQIFYGMSVSTMKEGMYDAGDDSSYFVAIKERLKESFEEATVLDSSFITVSTYPGYRLTVTGKTEGELLETRILAVSRGGISYYLYAVSGPGDNSKRTAERFLNSFKLLPFKYPEWKTVTAPDRSFSTTAPFSLKTKELDEEDTGKGLERYLVYDSLAYVTGFVDRTVLPSWFWYSSDTAFLRLRAGMYSSWGDSMVDYKLTTVGKLKTASVKIMQPGDNLLKKVLVVLNGDEIYEVFGNFATQDLPGKYNRFFDDFKVMSEKPGWNKSQPKVEELAATLKDADGKTVAIVKQWWDALEFTGADIPSLQKMLLQLYPDFDTTYYANLNKKLFEKIQFLDSTHTTVAYIKNNYASIQQKDEYVKGYIISYLAGISTAESYSVLKDCLVKYPLTIKSAPYFGYMLYDSLKLTATLFPEVMKQVGSEAIWEQIAGVATSLLDSNLLSKTAIKEYGSYFIGTAKKELEKEKTEIEDNNYGYSDLIRMLGVIGTPEAIALLKRFAKFDAREIKFRTLIALLESGQPADTKNIYTMATTDQYRHQLYDELKRLNKLKLFPASYLSQKELGKSKVYEYSVMDETEPGYIADAGVRTVLYKGKQQKFYLYKVSFANDIGKYHLGVAGPYSANLNDYTSPDNVAGIYWAEEFDAKALDKHLKEYLKSLEEEEEDVELPPPPPMEIRK
ncbi:MAG: TraB/GumN family protein [Chitinophagaceae bacterium]